MGRLNATLPGALLAVAVALLPLTIHANLGVAAAAAATGTICLLGLLIPSLPLALTGAILAEIVCAIVSAAAPNGESFLASFGIGTVVLAFLVLTHSRTRGWGAPVTPDVLWADLHHMARVLLVATPGAAVVILFAHPLAAPATPLRPVLAVAGGLLAFGAVVQGVIAQARRSR